MMANLLTKQQWNGFYKHQNRRDYTGVLLYTLTKIPKHKPVGRPMISGCDSQTERISAFVDKLIHPIAKI